MPRRRQTDRSGSTIIMTRLLGTRASFTTLATGDAPQQRDCAAVLTRNIYFGHQSVGASIVVGAAEHCAAAGVSLCVTDTTRVGDLTQAALVHERLGNNGDPYSKIDAFAARVDGDVGRWAHIALFKLCYVDVGARTDTAAVFDYYARTMARLRQRHPRLILAHVTMPVTRVPPRWQLQLKAALRRDTPGIADNIARSAYNEHMRRRYFGHEPVFDLAALESGGVPGMPVWQRHARGRYTALRPDLTDDGGHLSVAGRRLVATEFLQFLASCAQQCDAAAA